MKRKYYLIAILLVSALTTSIAGYAQTKDYYYDYDSSGNRIERGFIGLKSANIDSPGNHEQEVFEGTLDQLEIKIYPNPTKGNLKVEIPLDGQNEQINLQVFDVNGSLINALVITNTTTLINLKDQPAGLYIMRILSGQSVSEWKILKE